MPPEAQDQNILPLEEQHPFIYPLTDDLLKLVPNDEVKTLREWTAQQSTFPKLTGIQYILIHILIYVYLNLLYYYE